MMELILRKRPLTIEDFDENSNTPLHLAAQSGYAGTVELLLKEGASIHKVRYLHFSALPYLCPTFLTALLFFYQYLLAA